MIVVLDAVDVGGTVVVVALAAAVTGDWVGTDCVRVQLSEPINKMTTPRISLRLNAVFMTPSFFNKCLK
jgi:hypothetical protein